MAFILREIEEFSYAQVAEKMGISETNARARVHRARRSLTRALRGTGAALAGFPVPLHFLGLKRLLPRSASKRMSGLASYSSSSRIVGPGPDFPATAIPVTSQSSLPTLLQAPLSETSQAVALAASTPLSQTLIAGASVAWHATLPVAAALATVAASAAMVGSGSAASGPTTPDPAIGSHIIMAAGTTDLASFLGAPPTSSQPSPPAAPSGTAASSASSSSHRLNGHDFHCRRGEHNRFRPLGLGGHRRHRHRRQRPPPPAPQEARSLPRQPAVLPPEGSPLPSPVHGPEPSRALRQGRSPFHPRSPPARRPVPISPATPLLWAPPPDRHLRLAGWDNLPKAPTRPPSRPFTAPASRPRRTLSWWPTSPTPPTRPLASCSCAGRWSVHRPPRAIPPPITGEPRCGSTARTPPLPPSSSWLR